MRVIVQKYGGTSVSTVEKIRKVAEKVAATRRQGYALVVVVSAMGDSTDRLLDLARAAAPAPAPRELDMLLATGETASAALLGLALRALGEEAVSLSAWQLGIVTNDVHSNARILEVRPERIRRELQRGAVVVVPGFQGMTLRQEVTTLGRSGSDTTAVALAAALGAEGCEIYTDVEGVFSADPRVVGSALKLDELLAGEMQELAWHGAQVVKAEAVEFASTNGVPVVVRSTFGDDPGTLISPEPAAAEVFRPRRSEVAGVSGRKDLLRVTVGGTPSSELVSDELFAVVSKYDLIFGSLGGWGEPGDLFISNQEITDPAGFAAELEARFDGAVKVAGDLGAVSLVGFGLGSRPGALLDALAVLREGRVPLVKSFTGRESLSFVVPRASVDENVRRMHEVFVENRGRAAWAAAQPAS